MTLNSILSTNLQSILFEENKDDFDYKNFNSLEEKNKTKNINNFDFDQLETRNIFHLNTIRKICVDYRLRFLDIHFFKGEIPIEAIDKITQLEVNHNTKLNNFKLMAPSIMFRLNKADDPILFFPIGNNYYYLNHKWGEDLSPLRKLRMWPFLSLINLLVTLLFVSYLITWITPLQIFTKSLNSSTFWILFLFMFKALVLIVLFLGVALGENFNP